jgi:hypothetical protein
LIHLPVKRVIATEIEISAPPDIIWTVLTDLSGYGSWNPVIRRIEGNLTVGSRLKVIACLPCGLPMPLQPKLLEFKAEREIRWLGSLFIPGLVDGEHVFLLEPLGESKTRFVQREEFNGIFMPLIWRWLKNQVFTTFEMMNKSLKTVAERHEGAIPPGRFRNPSRCSTLS